MTHYKKKGMTTLLQSDKHEACLWKGPSSGVQSVIY